MKLINREIDLYKLLDQTVTGALAVFAVVTTLLIILFFLNSARQNAVEETNSELLSEIDDLQETTDALQQTVEILNNITDQDPENLEIIDQRLDKLDDNLYNIEQNIQDIVAEGQPPEQAVIIDELPPSVEEIEDIETGINQIFVFVSWLIGGLSIVTAAILSMVLNSRQKRRKVSAD
jgi:hypothetical protein